VDPNDYPTVVEIEHAIAVSESAWIAVEIKQDLTSGLESARDSADASWNPADGIQLYYSEVSKPQFFHCCMLCRRLYLVTELWECPSGLTKVFLFLQTFCSLSTGKVSNCSGWSSTRSNSWNSVSSLTFNF